MRIYELAVRIVRRICGWARRIGAVDPELARQMTRACMSVPLNLQEGLWSRGGNRTARLHNAMGSARETMACLDVCVAAGYLTQEQVAEDLKQIDQLVAGLYCLCYKRK